MLLNAAHLLPRLRGLRLLAAAAFALAVAACGGGSEQAPPPPVDRVVAGLAVVKARAGGAGVVTLEERALRYGDFGPVRTLGVLQADGRSVRPYAAPEGWSLADFALHPSGEISVVLTAPQRVRLVRLDRHAVPLVDEPFVDPAVAADPYYDQGGIKIDDAMQPYLMHDAARLAPLGEHVVLVLRSGRNAVLAYRVDRAAGGWQRAWRTLVEPGGSIIGRFLASGSHDVFGQLGNHVGVHVDTTPDGLIGVGVVSAPGNVVFEAHGWHFGEPIDGEHGAILTRLAPDGRRLGSTVVATAARSELHGVRASARGFALLGRVRSEQRADGSGWDGFAAFVGADGRGGQARVVDVDRGDMLFDAVPLAGGGWLALGATGYLQNPFGSSVTEEMLPLLLRLDGEGRPAERLPFPATPRQNQLRTALAFDGRWLLGGLRNGPGTHSGDERPALIVADGYLSEVGSLPPPLTAAGP